MSSDEDAHFVGDGGSRSASKQRRRRKRGWIVSRCPAEPKRRVIEIPTIIGQKNKTLICAGQDTVSKSTQTHIFPAQFSKITMSTQTDVLPVGYKASTLVQTEMIVSDVSNTNSSKQLKAALTGNSSSDSLKMTSFALNVAKAKLSGNDRCSKELPITSEESLTVEKPVFIIMEEKMSLTNPKSNQQSLASESESKKDESSHQLTPPNKDISNHSVNLENNDYSDSFSQRTQSEISEYFNDSLNSSQVKIDELLPKETYGSKKTGFATLKRNLNEPTSGGISRVSQVLKAQELHAISNHNFKSIQSFQTPQIRTSVFHTGDDNQKFPLFEKHRLSSQTSGLETSQLSETPTHMDTPTSSFLQTPLLSLWRSFEMSRTFAHLKSSTNKKSSFDYQAQTNYAAGSKVFLSDVATRLKPAESGDCEKQCVQSETNNEIQNFERPKISPESDCIQSRVNVAPQMVNQCDVENKIGQKLLTNSKAFGMDCSMPSCGKTEHAPSIGNVHHKTIQPTQVERDVTKNEKLESIEDTIENDHNKCQDLSQKTLLNETPIVSERVKRRSSKELSLQQSMNDIKQSKTSLLSHDVSFVQAQFTDVKIPTTAQKLSKTTILTDKVSPKRPQGHFNAETPTQALCHFDQRYSSTSAKIPGKTTIFSNKPSSRHPERYFNAVTSFEPLRHIDERSSLTRVKQPGKVTFAAEKLPSLHPKCNSNVYVPTGSSNLHSVVASSSKKENAPKTEFLPKESQISSDSSAIVYHLSTFEQKLFYILNFHFFYLMAQNVKSLRTLVEIQNSRKLTVLNPELDLILEQIMKSIDDPEEILKFAHILLAAAQVSLEIGVFLLPLLLKPQEGSSSFVCNNLNSVINQMKSVDGSTRNENFSALNALVNCIESEFSRNINNAMVVCIGSKHPPFMDTLTMQLKQNLGSKLQLDGVKLATVHDGNYSRDHFASVLKQRFMVVVTSQQSMFSLPYFHFSRKLGCAIIPSSKGQDKLSQLENTRGVKDNSIMLQHKFLKLI